MTTPDHENQVNGNGKEEEEEEKEEICFSKLAAEGITLLLNNKQSEAEALFKTYPDSIQMNAGYAYAVFTDAVMTFEDDKLHLALQTLKDIEKKCTVNTSWMHSVRSKMFGTDTSISQAEHLESEIILADSYLFVATLTFLQQDISGYLRGGWILRKSYKHFHSVYNEILSLYNRIVGDDNVPGKYEIAEEETIDSTTTTTAQGNTSIAVEVESMIQQETSSHQTVVEVNESELPRIENATITTTTTTATVITSVSESEPSSQPNIADQTDTISILSITVPSLMNNQPTKSTSAVVQRNKNGYILPHLIQSKNPRRRSIPKHSISCHDNLTSLTASSPCSSFATSQQRGFDDESTPLKNGYVKNKCKSSARSAVASSAATAFSHFRPFLKKSASVNCDLHESTSDRWRSPLSDSNLSLSYFTSTFNIFTNRFSAKDIDKETISRLLCAVSFGYGLLQLGLSLLPPSMLRLSSFLGFGGSRKNGLENLMFARRGSDMRAPFATLTLLWYHTIVRPFFALDGNNVQAGVDAAAQLIEETKTVYGQSALFLFFKGRVERLNSDIPAAIAAFQSAIDNAAQKEIKLMSLHEVGWCYLIELDFTKSENTFNRLKQNSRWSRSFYSYLTIISAGSNRMFQDTTDVRELRNVFNPVVKGTQLDEFLNRRYKICPLDEVVLKDTSCLFWKLLVYELLYLWNTLPSCNNVNIRGILVDCQMATEEHCEPMPGLAKLIEGSCLCILRRFDEGVNSFRDCLAIRKNMPYNCDAAHISAFAQYELGLLLVKDAQTLAEGKKLLQLVAYNYKDYDFEQRLAVRVHAILKHL